MGVDSVAEGFIWRPQFSPGVATVESEESRRGVRYFRPEDNMTPALPNLGKRQHSVKIGHLLGKASVNNVPVRKTVVGLVFTEEQWPRRVIHP